MCRRAPPARPLKQASFRFSLCPCGTLWSTRGLNKTRPGLPDWESLTCPSRSTSTAQHSSDQKRPANSPTVTKPEESCGRSNGRHAAAIARPPGRGNGRGCHQRLSVDDRSWLPRPRPLVGATDRYHAVRPLPDTGIIRGETPTPVGLRESTKGDVCSDVISSAPPRLGLGPVQDPGHGRVLARPKHGCWLVNGV